MTSSRVRAVALGGTALVVVGVALAVRAPGTIDVPTAIVLGLIEGLTEFLPVSSTGHLTVAEHLLGLRGGAADAYAIVIQAGAILAVVVLYRERLASMISGLLGRDPVGRRVGLGVLVAFVPAALLGYMVGDAIKDRLFGVGPVAAAWAAGGILILVAARRRIDGGRALDQLDLRQAAIIGVAQAAALWPGVSRSLVTILAALAVGLTIAAAVEFSFLLGFVTLGAATAYESLQEGGAIVEAYGIGAPIVGFLVAFIAAVASVRWMVGYLRDRSLAVFGYYRLAAAMVAVAILVSG